MSTGMRKWMEKDCPEIQCLPAQVSIDREEIERLRASLEAAERERDALRAKMERMEQPAPSVPDGWKLVTIEPTEEMYNAGANHCDGYWSTAQAVWDAMLAAAPEAKP